MNPQEVAVSRFGGKQYSSEMQLLEDPGSSDPIEPEQNPAPAPKLDAEKKPTRVQTLVLSKKVFPSLEKAHAWISEHNFQIEKPADETGESFRFRQIDPAQFDPNSFRSIELKNGVSAVVGHLKDATEEETLDPDEDDGEDKEAYGGEEEND